MIRGEFFINDFQKGMADIGGDAFAEWWVVPDDVSVSFSFRAGLRWWGCELEFVVVAAFVEGILVEGRSMVKSVTI